MNKNKKGSCGYAGKIGNSGTQVVEAVFKPAKPKPGKVIKTGKDLRTGK